MAHGPSTSSGAITATGNVYVASAAQFVGARLVGDGTHTCTATITDNNGVTITGLAVNAATGPCDETEVRIPISCVKGITCTLAGTGATLYVFYIPG